MPTEEELGTSDHNGKGGQIPRPLFKGFRGATQGYPLYPTILNVVVDAFIWHYITVVA